MRTERRSGGDGATLARQAPPGLLQAWLVRHAQTFFYSLGQLSRHPLATLLTAAVIGIALALPAGLQLLLDNVGRLTGQWDGPAQISLFLKRTVRDEQAQALARELERLPGVQRVQHISRTQALEEFRARSGFAEAIAVLEDNPLPPVLVVTPKLAAEQGAAAAEELLQSLRGRSEVDLAQLDLAWVQRVYAMMAVVRHGVWLLAALFALAVLLAVGNTIRLAVQNRRDEIVIVKLIGGTDAFIRRPFLYTGFWYGLLGGVIAVTLVQVALFWLQGPVGQLAALYHSDFRLQGLTVLFALLVCAAGCLLGLGGAWLAVGRHLRDIEPT